MLRSVGNLLIGGDSPRRWGRLTGQRRLIVEFDGKVKYSGKFGRSGADALFAEKRREVETRELTGYRFLRLTWEDLDDPARVMARIRALSRAVR